MAAKRITSAPIYKLIILAGDVKAIEDQLNGLSIDGWQVEATSITITGSTIRLVGLAKKG